jgi:hypothetical protein
MRNILLSSLFILFFLNRAEAGPRVVGNGGQGIVCSAADGEILSVASLDLYEAPVVHGLRVGDYHGRSLHQLLDVFADRIGHTQSYQGDLPRQEIGNLLAGIRLLPPGVRLKTVDDAGDIPFIPGNCEIKQIANYLSDGAILVDGDYWKKMDDLNRAVLLIHEYVYKIMRYWGDVDSSYARKVVGYLVSTEDLVPIKTGLGHGPYFHCQDASSGAEGRPKFELYVTPSESNLDKPAILQFYAFNGRLRFSRLTAKTNLPFSAFTNRSNGASAGQDSIPVESKISSGETLWWRYRTGEAFGGAFLQLSLAVTIDSSSNDTDFREVICGQQR